MRKAAPVKHFESDMNQELVLLAGLNTTSAVFDEVSAALPKGVSVTAPSLPPFDRIEAIVDELLPLLPRRFWLGGFSFGGYVALAMCKMAPDRVQGLALICSAPDADTPAQSQARLDAIEAASRGEHQQRVEAQTATAFHPDSLRNEALMARRRLMVAEYGANRFIAHQRAAIERPDRSDVLDGRVPTLLVAGSHDRLFSPSMLEGIARRVPGAAFEAVTNAGHLVPLEQPRQLADILGRWIQ